MMTIIGNQRGGPHPSAFSIRPSVPIPKYHILGMHPYVGFALYSTRMRMIKTDERGVKDGV